MTLPQLITGAEAATNTTAVGLEGIGKGGILALINQNLLVFCLIFFGILILILIPVILKYRTRRPSKRALKLAEIQQEREKFELMSKKVLAEELKGSKVVLNTKERTALESIDLDNSILARRVLFKMNEVENRTRRLELGTAGAQLATTLEEIKDQEQEIFKNQL